MQITPKNVCFLLRKGGFKALKYAMGLYPKGVRLKTAQAGNK